MRSKARYETLLGPALLLAIVVLFHWKLVLTNQYTWLERPDPANLVLPWFQFQAGEWHHFRFPLWDPNSWFGQPLFGQAQPGSAYPLNWLLFLVPLKHGWIREAALHWYFVLMRYLAALTCYALVRDLGRSRAASILAGCVYALGGYVASTVAPQMVNGAVWTPLVFLYLFRAERGFRPLASSLLSGFFLGAGWLAGHHQMNLFVSLAVVSLWLWFSFRSGKTDARMLGLAACSLTIAVFASAFQTLPTAEYGRRAVRWSGAPNDPLAFDEKVPYTVHEEYSLKPLSLLGIFIPNVEYKSNPYVGVAAFGLGLLGVILGWRERQVRWLATVALGGILFSLGPNSILHGIIYSLVPLVEKARVPGAATLVFAMGLAPLAAFGLDLLPRPESCAWSRRAGWTFGGLAIVLALASLVFWAAKVPSALADDRIMITALVAIAASALLAAWRAGAISPRAGAVILVALVLFELAIVTTANLPNRADPAQNPYLHRLAEHADIAAYIRNQGEAGRIEYDDTEIPYNIGDWYGLEAVNAYTASVPSNVWNMDLFSPRMKDFFGVRYYLGKTAQRAGLIEVFTGRSGVKVFENPTAFPRAWSVHNVTTLPDLKAVHATMADPGFTPLRTALLSCGAAPCAATPTEAAHGAAPQMESCSTANDEVEMPTHQSNYVRITANLSCRGMVILSDTWFPGWGAKVDGKSARIYEVYGGVRGVVADAGRHTIEMRYSPSSVWIGAAMSLLAALVALLAARSRA